MNLVISVKVSLIALLTTFGLTGVALAYDFSVTPTSITVAPGSMVATLTVKAGGQLVSRGQVRVMRWHRDDGDGSLEATRDVVASPPALNMAPNQELTIRIVRIKNGPVIGEECYRILVDQLPAVNSGSETVAFTLRHSVPLCFGTPS